MHYTTCRTIIFALFLLTSYSAIAQDKTTFNFEKNRKLNVELFGKVKELSVTAEDVRNKTSEITVYSFDKAGLPGGIVHSGMGVDIIKKSLAKEEVHYVFENGRLASQLNVLNELDGNVYQYDNNGNVILDKEYFQNILIKETGSKYDTKNRIIEKTEYLYGAFSSYDEQTQKDKDTYLYERNTFQYDKNSNLITLTEQNFRNNYTEEKLYKYDLSNNKIEEGQCFTAAGKDTCTYRALYGFEYNNKNQLIKEFQIAKFSPHNTDTYYKYDENGNETESIGYYIYPDKQPEIGYHFRYEYNKAGSKTKDVEVVGKYRNLGYDRYKTEVTAYDKYQNITLQKYVTDSGTPIKVITKKYKYDRKGNWIECETKEGKTHQDLQVTEKSSREIVYYTK